MKRAVIVLLSLMMLSALSGIIVETGSMRAFLYGTEPGAQYDNWISHVAEGIAIPDYNLYAPYDRQTNGFGNFRIASASELLNWGTTIDLFNNGLWDEVELQILAGGFPYQVVQFNDTDTGRTYYMLREIPNMTYYDDNGTADPYDDEIGAFAYGWGLYIYNPSGTRPAIITVPHPCDDFATPAVGLYALEVWNARYLMINGAGREVRWTNVGTYTNTKSLSDPTRVAAHPYNYAYTRFTDKIRAEFNLREFSPQIHSYDWNRHEGMPNNQISAGYQKYCPNLPIRDLSNLKHDLINQGRHLMIPANTIGTHSDVYLNDYYSVNYTIHEFLFDDGENQYPVNDAISLPAYSQNQQMLYTLNGWNDYDSYEPFFHIEMDELPNSYEQTLNNYKWFYGWNEAQQKWDYSNLFTHTLAYNSYWVHDMDAVMDAMFAMNDGVAPTDPVNLRVVNHSLTNITLAWDRSSAYDFDSYEILYATQPIGLSNYQTFDRANNSTLASQGTLSVNVTGLNNSNQYYFRVRARDKNNNYSAMSNEVTAIPSPANITFFNAYGVNNSVRLYWQVGTQTGNQGFKVYRRVGDGVYDLLDSYQANPALTNPTASSFEWWDNGVTNGEFYTYMISTTNASGVEYYHNLPSTASPRVINSLTLSNASGTMVDTIYFGNNPYASDGQDTYYDVSKNTPTSNYVWAAFWQQYWGNNGTHLAREIKGGYDVDTEMKTWVMRLRSDQIGSLTLSASTGLNRAEKLWIQDGGVYHNLMAGPYTYTNANSNIRTMTLFSGNMQGRLTHGNQANRLHQGGNNITFNWSYQYPFLIDHVKLSIQNGADSLLVSASIPNTQTSYSYTIPQMADMQNARLVADVIGVDGYTVRYISPYTFALVPIMNLAYFEPGWRLLSNPWPQNPLNVSNLFGPTAEAYQMSTFGGWAPATEFVFGTPLWVKVPDVVFYSSTSGIQGDEYYQTLRDGWNFIANPHLCAYDIKDIRFTVNGSVFRYGEMISQGLLSPVIFVYRNGRYETTQRIEPWESFLIKYYGPANLLTQVDFYPFFSAPDLTPPSAQWSMTLLAMAEAGGSEFKIGTHNWGGDDFDYRVDIPTPLAPPFTAPTSYLPVLEPHPQYQETMLYRKYLAAFGNQAEEQRVFNFTINTQEGDPVTFSFPQFDLPAGWQVLLMIDDIPHYVGSAPSFVWTPATTGAHTGYLRVSNYMVPNDDLVNQPISKLTAYPNPFNPDVNIAFNLARSEMVSVDIYNIRGQKVRSLHHGTLPGGNHKLLWNGKDTNGRGVSSGIYFARIKTRNSSRAIKMMLMK